jgi:hypothetical protein
LRISLDAVLNAIVSYGDFPSLVKRRSIRMCPFPLGRLLFPAARASPSIGAAVRDFFPVRSFAERLPLPAVLSVVKAPVGE